MERIRTSAGPENHDREVPREEREEETEVNTSGNGRDDCRMQSVAELLRTLSEAEEDAICGRTAPVEETFASIRRALMARENG